MGALELRSVGGLPEIAPGDDLAALIAAAAGPALAPGTVVCVAQKLVSKAEGRLVDLASVVPGAHATRLAAGGAGGGDARLVEVVLGESAEVVRSGGPVLITRTHHGYVCANAGVDRSNAPGDDVVVLLPEDPDGSARRLKAALEARVTGSDGPLAVLVSDSFGRAWRIGQVDVAIGLAGLVPALDPQGTPDRAGRPLQATLPALADELAAAAGLARTKAGGEGVVLARGLEAHVTAAAGPGAAALVRAAASDLFR